MVSEWDVEVVFIFYRMVSSSDSASIVAFRSVKYLVEDSCLNYCVKEIVVRVTINI